MGLDLLTENGTVVDGSGLPGYRVDVGVRDGRVVEVGRIRAPAERVIDADGLIAAPGLIDGHAHMDAQVAWDPVGSCSCRHAVTSVVMGNCGFALAPRKAVDREWRARCLTAVEDIPTEAFLAGIEDEVRMLTFDNASAWELADRGLVRPGYTADLLVFDEAQVEPRLPTVEQDLPAGARRLVRKADGIAATIVNGAVAVKNGDASGQAAGIVLKGRLAPQRTTWGRAAS